MTAASAVAGGAGWGRGGQAELLMIAEASTGKGWASSSFSCKPNTVLKKKLSLLIKKIAFLWLPCWGPTVDKRASEGQGAVGRGREAAPQTAGGSGGGSRAPGGEPGASWDERACGKTTGCHGQSQGLRHGPRHTASTPAAPSDSRQAALPSEPTLAPGSAFRSKRGPRDFHTKRRQAGGLHEPAAQAVRGQCPPAQHSPS